MGEELLDAQMVWQVGYLAMEMLMGSLFVRKAGSRDSDVPWGRVKDLTSGYPRLFELINGCYRFNIKDRLPLKRFLELHLF